MKKIKNLLIISLIIIKKSLNKGSFLLYNIMYKILRRYIMTTERFNEVVKDLTTQIKNTLIRKAGEYNLDDDRLSVFKRAAGIQQQTQAQALLGMMTKHVVSIYDYVEGNKQFTEALAREKIVDNLNYLILLYAVLEEEGFKKD